MCLEQLVGITNLSIILKAKAGNNRVKKPSPTFIAQKILVRRLILEGVEE
jgi:hypothetical protein